MLGVASPEKRQRYKKLIRHHILKGNLGMVVTYDLAINILFLENYF